MVEGDHIDFSVHCGPSTTLYLGTQSFTKIYKNPSGIPSRQRIRGTLSEGACAVVLPDPVVPYANSIFHQDQHWTLKPGALLILSDGHTSGRYACGERFAYTEYISNITVSTEERPILIERYHSHPATPPKPPTSVAPPDSCVYYRWGRLMLEWVRVGLFGGGVFQCKGY